VALNPRLEDETMAGRNAVVSVKRAFGCLSCEVLVNWQLPAGELAAGGSDFAGLTGGRYAANQLRPRCSAPRPTRIFLYRWGRKQLPSVVEWVGGGSAHFAGVVRQANGARIGVEAVLLTLLALAGVGNNGGVPQGLKPRS